MNDPSISHFPVGNGDMPLVGLPDGATLLLDCDLCQPDRGEERTAVHEMLLDWLKTDEKDIPRTDVFGLTHPDQDHCRGFADFFYIGDPAKYGDSDRRSGKILIDELWFAPRIFNENTKELTDDARAFHKEACRRIALFEAGDADSAQAGNRLRLFGASDHEQLEPLDAIRTVAGRTLSLVNGKAYKDVRLLVLAPIKRHSDDEDCARNDTSLALLVSFDVDGVTNACRILLGGDTSCEYWQRILELNDEKALSWDELLAPHHCSWYFFSTETASDSAKPDKHIMTVLGRARQGAFVVSSSKPIKDDDDDPPSYKAKQIYVAAVGEDHFLCTGDNPDEPITFIMTANGPQMSGTSKNSQKGLAVAIRGAVSTPRTYG